MWRPGQNAYFDVRITNTNSGPSDLQTNFFKAREREKKTLQQPYHEYRARYVRPISVLNKNGGAGPECLTFHRHLADRIATKTEKRYEKIISLIRIKLSFIILRSPLMCIRGSRSYGKRKVAENIEDIEITCGEARIP